MPLASSRQISGRALAALLIIAPAPSIGALVAFWIAPGDAGNIAYALGKLVLYGVPLAWLLLVDRQRPSLSRPQHGGLGVGLLLGVLIGGAVLAAYYLGLNSLVDSQKLVDLMIKSGLSTKAMFLLVCAWLAIVNALLEEYAFRWFITSRLQTLLPRSTIAAVLISSAIFTAHHVIVLASFFSPVITTLASLGVFVGGLAWSWCYARYQSIWPGYLSHVIVDAAIFIIGWQLMFGF